MRSAKPAAGPIPFNFVSSAATINVVAAPVIEIPVGVVGYYREVSSSRFCPTLSVFQAPEHVSLREADPRRNGILPQNDCQKDIAKVPPKANASMK